MVKAGFLRGRQRFHCKDCGVYFTDESLLKSNPGRKKRHQTTIIDIARELGIAPSTVSRALHGHQDVNEDTRAVILKTAAGLNYQPNRLAYNLVKSSTNLIGIIVPEFHNQFFPDVIRGAQEVVTRAGYNLMIMQSDESYSAEVANTCTMVESRVEGILCSLAQETNNFAHLEGLQDKGIPLVLFNRVANDIHVPKVVVNDFEGAFTVVEHLVLQGYRRIAHLGGPSNLLVSRERLQGYMAALEKYGLYPDAELIIAGDLSPQKGRIYGQYLLDRENPPDAIFAVNDPIAIELMLLAKERGISIPDQLGIAGFSDDRISRFIEPGLTTMKQPTFEMGRVAAGLLIELVTESAREVPLQTVLTTNLIVRGSSLKDIDDPLPDTGK